MSQMIDNGAENINDAAVESDAMQNGTEASSPAPAGDGSGVTSDAGTVDPEFGGDWKSQLPEAWRGQVDGFENLEQVLDAAKRGQNYMPAASADDLIANWPEYVEVDQDVNKAFRELGVKIGLTKEQAQALVDFECQSQQAMASKVSELELNQLRQTWGTSFEANSNRAMETVLRIDQLMEGRLSAALGPEGLKGSAVLMEAFAHIGKLISEDSIAGGNPAVSKDVPETAEDMFRGMFH